MSTASASPPSAEDLLQAFAVNTMATDNLVVAFVGAERALLEQVQARAVASAHGVDTTDLALKLGGDRLLVLVQMHERLGRTLRLTIALKRRIETGWPRRGDADDRRTMARRQVARAVGEKIRAERGEAAERLLHELHERLWDPSVEAMLDSMTVEEVIAAVAREFTAARDEVDAWVRPGEQPNEQPSEQPSARSGDDTPPPPPPGPFPQGEGESAAPVARPWPAGMVNPPARPYEPWSPEFEALERKARAWERKIARAGPGPKA